MGLLDRLFSKGTASSSGSANEAATPPYEYRGSSLPQKPLTPQEIEALYAKLNPEEHKKQKAAESSQEKRSPDPQDWRKRFPLPLDENSFANSGQPTNPQTQSLLFSRLPREVRMQIWSYVVGSYKLYVTVDHARLAQASKMDDFGWWKKNWLLNVPLICRIAYVESIESLYASNTFCIGFGGGGAKQAIISIDSLLREQHIASIRHIELGWHFVLGYTYYFDSHPQAWDPTITVCAPDTNEDWRATCAQLAQLPRLKSVKIAVWTSGSQRAELGNQEEELLAPLTKITHLKQFSVLLPWTQTNPELWKDAPFRVSRRFRNIERFGVSIPLSNDTSRWPS